MRDALQMSSPDSAAPTCHPKKPLGQPRVPLPTSKNRSSADPLDQRSCRQGLQAISMENPTQFTASNDRGRRQAMRRKLRWMKRAMCPWRLLQTRINVMQFQPRLSGCETMGTVQDSWPFQCYLRGTLGSCTTSFAKGSYGTRRPTQFPTSPSQIRRYLSGVMFCHPAICVIASAVLHGCTKNAGAPVPG